MRVNDNESTQGCVEDGVHRASGERGDCDRDENGRDEAFVWISKIKLM